MPTTSLCADRPNQCDVQAQASVEFIAKPTAQEAGGNSRRRNYRHAADDRCRTLVNPWVEEKFNPDFNLGADDSGKVAADDGGMTTSEYLLNAAFVLLVLRQAKERELDRRSVIVPLLLMFFVGAQYLHTLPTAGNDPFLIVVLSLVGLTLGVTGGFATQVRAGEHGAALARVGWIAGGLLVLGIGARMAFAFAIGHGFEPAVRSFSIAHQIGAAAWPVALVLMALVEVGSRIAVVQVRGRRLVTA